MLISGHSSSAGSGEESERIERKKARPTSLMYNAMDWDNMDHQISNRIKDFANLQSIAGSNTCSNTSSPIPHMDLYCSTGERSVSVIVPPKKKPTPERPKTAYDMESILNSMKEDRGGDLSAKPCRKDSMELAVDPSTYRYSTPPGLFSMHHFQSLDALEGRSRPLLISPSYSDSSDDSFHHRGSALQAFRDSPTYSSSDPGTPSPGGQPSPSLPSSSGSLTRKNRSLTTSDEKDEAYWERRKKNNKAAKKSRDSRRQREELFKQRYTEMENHASKLESSVKELTGSVQELTEKNKYLESTLDSYKIALQRHGFDSLI